ncbi:MAG: 50S ribosomal protein L10 [Candidatus Magasanikbacteria bacterium]
MTKTRAQKEEEVEDIKSMLEDSKGFMIVGFTEVPVQKINKLRGSILEEDGRIRVVKKNLLELVLDEKDIDFELEDFLGQTGLIAFSGSLADVANVAFNFAENKKMEVFGGYDLVEDAEIDSDFMEKVGHLPSREVLLGQVAAAVGAPLRAVMQGLKKRADSIE